MRNRKWLSPIITSGILAILFLWVLYQVGIHTEIPHQMKLVDCTNSTLKVHLKVPKGSTYSLVLSTPGVGMEVHSPYKFAGRVHISDGTHATIEFPIGSDFSESCNWIPDSTGFILTRGTNCPDLSRFVHPQVDYDIEIVFGEPPPSSTSIWLCWLQTPRDKGK
jgi:hypothetical protein